MGYGTTFSKKPGPHVVAHRRRSEGHPLIARVSRSLVVGVALAILASTAAWSEQSRSSGSSKSLQAKASDPTEPLVQLTIDNDLAVSNRGGTGVGYQLLVQPVIPLPPFRRFPVGQIVRPSIPVILSPGPDRVAGLGDITLFDIFLPRRFSWGALGAGPVAVFPSATDDRLGQGKWQLGPAAALIYEAIAHLQLGVILQNPISVAGDDDREGVNALVVQPIAQYNLSRGYYVSIGDFTWSFDWKNGGKPTIPLALQVGRVMPIFGHQWNLAVEPFYLVAHDGPSPRWGFRFGISLLLPEG
jgi:hypothetical protein